MSRKLTTGDSLDLLLDTICNTFGGVLFISLLVVVLLNLSGSQLEVTPPNPATAAKLEEAELRFQESQAELAALRLAAGELEAVRQQFQLDPDAQRLLLRVKSREQERVAIAAQRDDEFRSLAESRRQVNQQLEELKRLEGAIRAAKQELDVVRTELKQEIELRNRTATLPKEGETKKESVGFLLRQGQLCAYADVLPNGQRTRNPRETVDRRQGNVTYVEPVIAAGLPIRLDDSVNAALNARLSTLNRSMHYATVVVWPDSFAHFGVVRQHLVKLGLEYELIPWAGDRPLSIGTPQGAVRTQGSAGS